MFLGWLGVHSKRLVPGLIAGCSWAVLVFTHYRLVPGLVAGCPGLSWCSHITSWYLAWRLGVPGLSWCSLIAGCMVPSLVAWCSWAGLVFTHYKLVPGLEAGCSWAVLVFTHYRLVPGLEAWCSWVGGGVGSCGAELPWDKTTSSNILNFPSPETTTRR